MEALQKQNRPILVRVLTNTGPQYWAKELTTRCFRYSRELYYTEQFADLLLSILLMNQGRITTSVDTLVVHFGGKSEVPGLLPTSTVVWNNLVSDLISHPRFKTKVNLLKRKAAAAGECTVISHDETYKTLFCLIGQEKMKQSSGELHALHTYRGFTGCVLGVSAQRSSSVDCFKAAFEACFDGYMAAKVRFLFSDSPLRIIKAAREVFGSLLAIGEDPLHLPFRLE